jgi:peptidoglycan/xylan/chitin deacetylase (PgdA/CDA1 family)
MREKQNITPTFMLSLDTELLWGGVSNIQSKVLGPIINDASKGRGSVKTLLSLSKKYNIPITWAMVGHLFLDHCQKENGIPHRDMPRFQNDWYSLDPCTNIKSDPLFYGRDIVEEIMTSSVKHEIGYHSFSHVPFSECSRTVAKAEINRGLQVAKELDITLKSFVFPYNKIGHVDVLREAGFKIYRGQDLGAITVKNSSVSLVNRFLNRILPPQSEPKWINGIWEIASSTVALDKQLRLPLVARTKFGIRQAISTNGIFHICMHPHDLLYKPSLEKEVDQIFAFVDKMRQQGKLQVLTMIELAILLKRPDAIGGQIDNS